MTTNMSPKTSKPVDPPSGSKTGLISPPAALGSRSGFSFSAIGRRPEIGALMGTIVVFVFFSVFGGQQFLSAGGFASWLNVASELAVVSIPVGVLMIAGEFDLSVGSILAASSISLALVSGTWGLPIWLGIIVALVIGVGAGFINGLVVTRSNVPSFIVTLAMQFALAGLTLGGARLLTGDTSINVTPDPVSKALLGTLIGGKFEVTIFWAAGIAIVMAWILQNTRYGNWIFAIGGDKESARAAGVPVAKVKIGLFMASGFGAAAIGIIQTILYNGAQSGNGQSFVFNAVIAAVVGGVLLTGGFGSVVGIILGSLTFAIVNQGIYYTGWDSDWASLILGILTLAAVLANNTFRRLALSGSRSKTKSSSKGA